MPAGATYEPIATINPSGTSNITFNSFGGYTDLRIVFYGLLTTSTSSITMRVNGDSTSIYSQTNMTGTGSSAVSDAMTNYNNWVLGNYSTLSTTPSLWTVDLFSYTGSTNKTSLITVSADLNGSGNVERFVGLYRSTSAITSITIIPNSGNVSSSSRITLYGIKAA